MNIRQIARFKKPYSQINREERNYAAILYSALLMKDNLHKFIAIIKSPLKTINNDFGVYFEYAFLRDIWYDIKGEEANDIKRNIVKEKLPISNIAEIHKLDPFEFNKYFGVVGKPSKDHIQFPGNWSIRKYQENIINDDDFVKICRFKWSFNIKPDIVVHLNKDEAICIEAKHESGEGYYPSNNLEKNIFYKKNNGELVRQTELQRYMMEELLGIRTHFIFIVSKNNKSETHTTFHWNDILKEMDTSMFPLYALDMVQRIGVQAK